MACFSVRANGATTLAPLCVLSFSGPARHCSVLHVFTCAAQELKAEARGHSNPSAHGGCTSAP